MGADVVSVFILPPDGKALERRLRTRAPGHATRWCAAPGRRRRPRSSTGTSTTTSIVNADLDASSAGLAAILAAERLKRERQSGPRRLRARRAGGAVRRRWGQTPRLDAADPSLRACARGLTPSPAARTRRPAGRGRARSSASARSVGAMPAAASRASGFGGQRAQALAQHLAALAEGGGGHGAERLDAALRATGCSMGVNSTMAEDTEGAGVKASGFTVNSRRGRVRHWAMTASRP